MGLLPVMLLLSVQIRGQFGWVFKCLLLDLLWGKMLATGWALWRVSRNEEGGEWIGDGGFEALSFEASWHWRPTVVHDNPWIC